jgi:hypothetical protein
MSLPEFSLEATVSAETATHDLIRCELGGLRIRGEGHHIVEFQDRMCVPASMERDPYRASSEFSDRLMIFSRPRGDVRERPNYLPVRKKRFAYGGQSIDRPLFGGTWRFLKVQNVFNSATQETNTKFHLSLNPTRFVRCQSPRLPRPAGQWLAPVLFSQKAENGDDEFSLDDDDNWIPDTDPFNRYISGDRWEEHFQRYYEGVTDTLVHEATRQSTCESVPGSVTPDVSIPSTRLRQVETYWEFASPNPILQIEALDSLLPRLTRRLRRHAHYVPENAQGIRRAFWEQNFHNNLVSYRMELERGVTLRIYAKTNRRIRFEVVHEMGHQKYALPGGANGDNWNSIPEQVLSLREHAAVAVNRTLLFLNQQNIVPLSTISPMDFLTKLSVLCKNDQRAKFVLSKLIAHGSVDARSNCSGIKRALNRLSSEGVLEYHSPKGTYTVAPDYRRAFNRIKETKVFAIRPRVMTRKTPDAP